MSTEKSENSNLQPQFPQMYCLCVNMYCHRVTTQLQLINIISYTFNWFNPTHYSQ